MIDFKTGNILKEDAEAIVNTVNCVGVMGRGIALQFKKAYPENFKAYAKACKRDEVRPGGMFVTETGQLMNPRYIINFPTKRHWRGKSRIEDIRTGLEALVDEIHTKNIRSIAIPPLGSGLGGLDWSTVRPLIQSALEGIPNLRVVVFEPSRERPLAKPSRSTEVPKMTEGRAALILLMNRYLGGLLDPFVTLLELHKLLYFLQEAGEPLRLRFKEGHYGPYAENLRHVLNAIEGHFIAGYGDGGDAPTKELKLVPGALEDAARFLVDREGTQKRLERVSQLVDGWETQFGLELLSTVHWVLQGEAELHDDCIVERVHSWGAHKKQFTPRQIQLAAATLQNRNLT